MAGDSETISFRVPKHVAMQLKDGAGSRGISRSDYARLLVQGALEATTTNELLAEITELKASLAARPVLGSEAVHQLSQGIAKELGAATTGTNIGGVGLQDLIQTSLDLKSTLSGHYRNLEEAYGQILQFLRSAEQGREPRPATTGQIDDLHESLATAVVALLIRLGSVEPKEAEAWAHANILRNPNNGRPS